MKCPECKRETKILNTRQSNILGYKRRRECPRGHRFTTVESIITVEQMYMLKLKRSNKR